MKNNKSKRFPARGVISISLSFLMSFFISVLGLAVLLQGTVMSQGYLKKQIEKSGFAAHILEEIKDSFVSYGLASGFEEDFCAALVTEDRVKNDLFREVSVLYSAEDARFDEKAFEEEIYQKLARNVSDRNIALDDENEAAVHMLAKEYVKVYAGHIEFPVADQITDLLEKARKPLLLVGGAALVLTIFTLIFLSLLYRRKYKFAAYTTYALGGAFLLLGLPGVAALFSGRIERLGVTNKALYFLLQGYLSGILYGLLIAAAVILALAVLMFIVYYLGRKQFVRSMSKEHHKEEIQRAMRV